MCDVDVLDSVTAERRLARHMVIPYICPLGHHAHLLADSQTSHSSPGRPPMPYVRTFAASGSSISFVNIDIVMFMVQFGVSIPASLIDFHMTKQQSMHISEKPRLW